MQRVLRSIFSLFVAGLAILASAQSDGTARDLVIARSSTPAGLPVYTGSHALIVGINRYPKLSKDKQLAHAVDDATAMAKVLIDSYGFKKSEVRLLTDGDATLANLRAALADLANPAIVRPDDRVLVYFAGHGQGVRGPNGDDLGFLIPTDGKIDLDSPKFDDYAKTCLPMQEVWDKLDPSPAKHVAVIADACFSGRLAKSRGASDYAMSAFLTMPARQLLAAGGKGQSTWELPEYGHGVFTYTLLQELQKRSTAGNSLFTLAELYGSIVGPVAELSKGRQTPQYSSFFSEGQMLFFPSAPPADGPVKTDPPVKHDPPTTDPSNTDPTKPEQVRTARLTVRTRPDGAKVSINGEDAGTTPVTKDLPFTDDKKSVHVKVELDGYATVEQDVDLNPKRETKLNFRLEKVKTPPPPARAHVVIETNPPGAKVTIDGVDSGLSPVTTDLAIGPTKLIHIHAELDGYLPIDQDAALDPLQPTQVSLTLEKKPVPVSPKPSKVLITSTPPGADVYIDGLKVGKTPYTLERMLTAATTAQVRIEAPGFKAETRTISLDLSASIKLPIILTKAAPPVLPSPAKLRRIGTIPVQFTPTAIQVSSDGKLFAATGRDHSLSIYEVATGRFIKAIAEPAHGFVRLTPDFKTLVFATLLTDGKRSWATVLTQDFVTGAARIYSADMAQCTGLGTVWTNGTTVLLGGQTGDGDAGFAVLDLPTAASIAFNASGRLSPSIASLDGRTIAVLHQGARAGYSIGLILMRGKDHTDQVQLPIDDNDYGASVAVSPSGDLVAAEVGVLISGGQFQDNGFRLFESATGKLRFSKDSARAIGFIDQGKKILA